jgi:hypothetical protein
MINEGKEDKLWDDEDFIVQFPPNKTLEFVMVPKEKHSKDKNKEYILCAAVWYLELPMVKPNVLDNRGFRPYNVDKGVVFSGWRHGNCIYQMVAITGLRSVPSESGPEIQGFLTNKNRFVDREEAAQIAFDAGQTETLLKRLFSEDLY